MTLGARSRRVWESQTRYNLILDTAEELLAEKGLHRTSISDIAKASEFGVGTIYKYFENKDSIIETLLKTRLQAHFNELLASINTDGTPVERLDRLIEAYFASVTQRQLFFKFYYTSFHPGPVEEEDTPYNLFFLKELKLKVLEDLKSIFDAGIALGLFIDIDSDYLAATLFGMLISFWFVSEQKSPCEIDLAHLKKCIGSMFLHKTPINMKR